MAKPIQYCKVKKRKKICVEVRVESKSLGRISSVLPALSAWGHSLLEPVAREDLGLALAGSQRHPWLTQPLFTSHGMQSCWGRGRDSQPKAIQKNEKQVSGKGIRADMKIISGEGGL